MENRTEECPINEIYIVEVEREKQIKKKKQNYEWMQKQIDEMVAGRFKPMPRYFRAG